MITVITKTKVAAFKPGTFCDQSKTYKSSFFMSTIDNISSNDRFSRYGLFIDDLDPVPAEDMKIFGGNQ